MILGKVGNAGFITPFIIPLVRFQFSEQDFQKGGFSDSVGSDNGNFFAPFKFEIDAIQNLDFVKLF